MNYIKIGWANSFQDSSVLFIDATKECVKVTNSNKLTAENIEAIYSCYMERLEKEKIEIKKAPNYWGFLLFSAINLSKFSNTIKFCFKIDSCKLSISFSALTV